MSRSIKKHNGGTVACCKNIKDDRIIYHRNERAKTKRQLKEVKLAPDDDLAIDKICTEKVDYNVKWADNWSWTSDGGSGLISTDSEIKQSYESFIRKGPDFAWNAYIKNDGNWNWRRDYEYIDFIAVSIAPKGLNKDELYNWLLQNGEKVISVYRKKEYGK